MVTSAAISIAANGASAEVGAPWSAWPSDAAAGAGAGIARRTLSIESDVFAAISSSFSEPSRSCLMPSRAGAAPLLSSLNPLANSAAPLVAEYTPSW